MKTFYYSIGIIFLLTINMITSTNNDVIKQDSSSIYQFKLNDLNGDKFDFKKLKGKVILLVNVASKCGFTGQYTGLQRLYNDYKKDGFVVVGVPSNDFGGQEPGNAAEINDFCAMKFNVSFPLLEKSKVKGRNAIPLYQFLTDKTLHPKTGGDISWNFNKFLIDQNGIVVSRYSSFTKPESNRIKNDINNLISRNEE